MNLPTEIIPFSRPSIGFAETRAVSRVLRSGWLTSGRENNLFEEEFCKILHSPYALSVNSATAGLHLAVESLNLGPDGFVIVPAYTFTASAEILYYCGLRPLFADVDSDYNISVDAVRDLLKAHRTSVKALIVVHIAGLSCKMDELSGLSKEFGIPLIEDCAHAFPVETEKGMLGTLGDIGVFSFYANKTITTGEGGMIVCKDESLYKRMKSMRLHGIDRDAWNRYCKGAHSRSWEYDVIGAGFKYNLTNF